MNNENAKYINYWYGTEKVVDGIIVETIPKSCAEIYKYIYSNIKNDVDEYFSIDNDFEKRDWPTEYRWIAVYPVTGGSEGHYIHVEIIDNDGKRSLVFLGKTFLGINHAWEICKQIGTLLEI